MIDKATCIQYWNTPVTGVTPGHTPRMIFRDCGAPNFHVDRFIADDIGDVQIRRFENYILYPDEMAPEVMAYWEKKGLIKEMHRNPETIPLAERYVTHLRDIDVCRTREEAEDRWAKWTSYLPASTREGTGRKYPLMFLLHGGDDPIYMTETYGFLDLAAEEEIIVIAPQDAGYQSVGKLLDYALEHFPVDAARVYCVGFSGGAAKTEDVLISYPERFAAGAMVGQLLRRKFYCDPTEEHLQHVRDVKIAAVNIQGLTEAGRTLPMNISQEFNPCIPDVQRSITDNVNGLNDWLGFIGSRRRVTAADLYSAAHSADDVERAVGTVFDRTRVERHFERTYYVGDYFGEDGVNRLRVVGVEDVPHWPVPGFAEFCWDFISRFRRDIPSGKLICMKET